MDSGSFIFTSFNNAISTAYIARSWIKLKHDYEWWSSNDLERDGLFKVLPLNLPANTKEKHKTSFRITCKPEEIRLWYLLNPNTESYHYIKLLSRFWWTNPKIKFILLCTIICFLKLCSSRIVFLLTTFIISHFSDNCWVSLL
jgi:hypothetical protein